jgi:hypothetical protein
MAERLKSYDRKTVKESFSNRFGEMIEKDKLQAMLGKNVDIDALVEERKIMCIWPGGNMPVFPYFQLSKGKLRPQIETVLKTIDEVSEGAFITPLSFCEWMFEGEKGKKPLDLLKIGNDKELIKRAGFYAEKFRKRV